MNNQSRPDLSNRVIYFLLTTIIVTMATVLSPWLQQPPGSPNAQWAAVFGVLALLAPMLFSLLKRSGLSASPPFWFVTHVLCACLGAYFIFYHAAAGDWLSPPGLVLMLMLFLIIQGALLRSSVSKKFSELFARSAIAPGFSQPVSLNKTKLAHLISTKQKLLLKLDPNASEALFSPNLRHWLRHPYLSWRYQRYAAQEAKMVGARASAGGLLGWSRRLHMIAATFFYLGLVTHVIVVLFFAGYAAGSEEIDWWYITAYGADWGQ